jgi:hypothetical protein
LAAALLIIGVLAGIVGLFPDYLDGSSLAQQPAELVPHVVYFAVWSASALFILLGKNSLRPAGLLAVGTSVVTFGLYFADAGTAIAGGAHVMGAGLVLGLVGWVACAAGSGLAFARAPGRDRQAAKRGFEPFAFIALTLGGLGAAAAFAPSWDSYVLKTAAGVTESLTAGNVFSNPGPIIAGNLAVMIAFVAVVVAAALWRPVLEGAALLSGAVVPMVAQAISAFVQLGEHVSPTMFGISPSAAQQSGLTITSGVTLAFWIYCAFVLALIAGGASILLAPHPLSANASPSGGDLDGTSRGSSAEALGSKPGTDS